MTQGGAGAGEGSPGFGRELSMFDVACVVVGGIIGVGIFFTPGTVASRVASTGEMMSAWGIGGLLAVLGALVFAELSARVPGHGGIFRYIQAAFGPLPAFVYGWANWLVIQSGALSIVALICIEHLERAVFGEVRSSAHLRVLLAAALILAIMATNLRGLRVGKRVQNALTVAKVAALCLLAAAALFAACRAAAPPVAAAAAPAGGIAGRIASAMLPVLFAIGGWQQGSFLAGAAKRPQRDVPFGILLGVAVVIAVYMAINVAYVGLLGFDGAAHTRSIGADAARVALGSSGERVFAAMVAVSAAGIMNTICMAPPYVLMTMAEAGLFPRAFARRHPRHGTPTVGVLAQGLWATALLLLAHGLAALRAEADHGKATVDTLDFVCDSVVFVDWLFFTLCGLALLRLRRRGTGTAFGLPAAGLVAALFAAGAAAVALGAVATKPWPSLVGAGLVALALPARRWLRAGAS